MPQSLRWRIPLFVSGLIVVVLATFLVAAHRQVESTLVRAARDRAAAAASQFTEPLGRGMQANLVEGARLAGNAAVRAFAVDPSEETRSAAVEALAPRAAGLFRKVEVWTADGRRLLDLSTPGKTVSGQTVFFPSEPAPTGSGMSHLRAAGELSYFDVTSEIHAGSPARLVGYLRRYGRISYSGNIRNLIGDGAIVRAGSPNGTWTDMLAVSNAPPIRDPGSDIGEHRAPDGARWVGAAVPIPHTPLVIWAGFPREQIVAPARPFIERMGLVALGFVAIAVALVALFGVRLSRRVTAVTAAAGRLASGDYSGRVPPGRQDELGQLSEAFNSMAARINEAHQALQESHARTQFALAGARIGIWESDLGTGRMTCSESIAAARGLPPDAVPASVDEFLAGVHPDDRAHVREALEGRQSDGEPFEIQYRIVNAAGAVRWIEAKGRPELDEHERVASVLGLSIDVTEKRALESQLRQAQKMEAVGQLAGGVAHDFNNLLTAVVGHGNLALQSLPEDHPAREDVLEILNAGDRAAGLTRQLLAFSRRQVMQPEIVAVNAVVSGVEQLLRRLIGEQIHIALDLAASTDAVKVDPGQLEQVLMNLAVNARDAMPEGGTLTIATANVDLDTDYVRQHANVSPGRYVIVTVADTGSGMDAQTQAHLFEPFYTTKPAGKGTGLGLATVYGIVQQSGGYIYVYSEPGSGTTFKVYLPATDEKPTPRGRQAERAQEKGGTDTILVVEDNPQVRAIATRILTQLGYRVLAASSGEDALALQEAETAQVDLVISDVIMPGMTGPELCRQLSARYPGIRVLFTSGYSNEAIVRHGVLEAGTMFIEKPYTPGALARKVREALAV